MSKRVYALDPNERDQDCGTATRPHAFRYTGEIPCTGPQVCMYCGDRPDDRFTGKFCLACDDAEEVRHPVGRLKVNASTT